MGDFGLAPTSRSACKEWRSCNAASVNSGSRSQETGTYHLGTGSLITRHQQNLKSPGDSVGPADFIALMREDQIQDEVDRREGIDQQQSEVEDGNGHDGRCCGV